jgi:hypothetical protein
MLRCIRGKVGSLLDLGVGLGLSHPMQRNNTHGRPGHPDLNCRHEGRVHKCPQLPYKKCCFTHNKLNHTKVKAILHLAGMVVHTTFTTYITPPHTCNISQTRESQKHNSPCTSILVKEQYHRNSQKLNTLCGQCRPRTRIYQVIPMMGSSTSRSSLHIFLLCERISHYFN